MNQRIPVAVSLNQGTVVTTGGSASFEAGNPTAALETYLRLVRRMRSQRREPEISIRQRDVDALAIDLRMPADAVLDELSDLMGVTRAQLPTIVGFAAAAVTAVAVVAVAVPIVANMVSSDTTPTQTNLEVSGDVPAVESPGPAKGVWIEPDGTEIEVELGGAPLPPAAP